MLVVITIIGLIAGVSYPSISSGMDSIRLSSATRSIASFLNSAVTRAERRQQPVELVISPAENRFQMLTNEAGFERELLMPEGIKLEAVLPEEPEASEPVRRFLIMPGATVPAIGIQLANQHGSRRIVRMDPMTGYPRVESVEHK
jgi:type II secretory pathway pseudopilin PulG